MKVPSQASRIQYAILHCYGRESVVPERSLLAAALHYGVGQVDEVRLQGFFHSRPEFIRREVDGRVMVTTRGVLAEEQAIVAWAQAGRGVVPALAPGYELSREIHLPGRDQPLRLSDEQFHAVQHVLATPDRLIGVRGLSGTGKTTLLHAVVGALEDRHHQVLLMTPKATAAREELPRDGFKNTHTIASVLMSAQLQNQFRGGVWLVDEAGMLSGRDLYRLVHLADEHHARLVVMGDPHQHEPIDRGNALRLLEQEAGLPMARVQTILRQKDPHYRQAVQLFAEQRAVEGFDQLDALGKILALPEEERYQHAAGYYMQALADKKSVAIISPTHREGRKVTAAIRNQLRAAGQITDERIVPSLCPIDMNEAARRDARNYLPGMVVEVVQNVKGLRGVREFQGRRFRGRGRLQVVATSERPQDGVVVERSDHSRVTLPVHECGRSLKAFAWHPLQVGRGDRLRITMNGWSDDGETHLRSGTLRTVQRFTPAGQVILDNGVQLAHDFGHLTHGYVDTSMGAQGKTVDRVLTVESAESFGAASLEQAYVSVSRGREECVWTTNDKEELLEAVLVSSQRPSALGLVPEAPKLDYVEAVQLREAQERAIARIGAAPAPGTTPGSLEVSSPHGNLRRQLGSQTVLGNMGLTPALRENPDISLAERLQAAHHRRAQVMQRRREWQQEFEERKRRQREMEQGVEPEM